MTTEQNAINLANAAIQATHNAYAAVCAVSREHGLSNCKTPDDEAAETLAYASLLAAQRAAVAIAAIAWQAATAANVAAYNARIGC